MSPFVDAALIGWAPVTLILFLVLPARRAILASFVLGWLFLPQAGIEIRGLPNYTKTAAVTFPALLGAALFDLRSLASIRPKLIDAPMAAWCAAPIGSSLANGLGLYDGVSVALDQMIVWGVPYLLGRAYFADVRGARELAIALLVAGLIYVPLCLYEIRMSPQLHTTVYGYHQHVFIQTKRWGGWRPTVFLQHGLAVGMVMAAASLAGVWLWRAGSLRQLLGVPTALILPVLVVTAVLCKSIGALACLGVGLGVLFASRWGRTVAPILCLAAIPPVYVTVRATGAWSGESVVGLVERFSGERAGSLRTRINSEDVLAARAMESPVFGWGGYGRSRVKDEWGGDAAITDGLWIIAFGQHGLVGLAGLIGVMILPAARGIRLFPPAERSAWWAGPGVLCVVLLMYALDSLMNAMLNPLFHLAIGAMAGVRRPPAGAMATALRGYGRSPMAAMATPATAGERRGGHGTPQKGGGASS